jgi:hypothetical protein
MVDQDGDPDTRQAAMPRPGTRPAGAGLPAAPRALPHFDVQISAPDISPWLAGNTGVAGFTSFAAAAAGPHVVLLALTHGNEIAGAVVLDRMLAAGVRPRRGRLTFGLVNLAAYARFDPEHPTSSRFVDEDMNRLWDPQVLNGPRRSIELDRAREVRALIDSADVLLDLHSMLWPSEALILCGPTSDIRAARASSTTAASPPRRRRVLLRRAPPSWWRPASTGRAPRWTPCWPPPPGCCVTPKRSPTTISCPRPARPGGRFWPR